MWYIFVNLSGPPPLIPNFCAKYYFQEPCKENDCDLPITIIFVQIHWKWFICLVLQQWVLGSQESWLLFQRPELPPVSQILILITLLNIFYVFSTVNTIVRQTDIVNPCSQEAYSSRGHTGNCRKQAYCRKQWEHTLGGQVAGGKQQVAGEQVAEGVSKRRVREDFAEKVTIELSS